MDRGVKVLPPETPFTVIEVSGNWIRIRTSEGDTGFVVEELGQREAQEDDPGEITVAETVQVQGARGGCGLILLTASAALTTIAVGLRRARRRR